jgi:hypothetical protein
MVDRGTQPTGVGNSTPVGKETGVGISCENRDAYAGVVAESATMGSATDREPEEEILDRLTWLSSKEAAKYLRKTANALRIMTYRGYLKPRRFRRRLYFLRIELDRLLESSAY